MRLRNFILAALAIIGCAPRSAGADAVAPFRTEPAPERAVADLIALFSDATTAHDFAAMADLFSRDAVWEATGDALAFRLEGADAIRAAFVRNDETLEVVFQQIGPSVVRVTAPDRASARTSVLELLRFKATGEVKQIVGVYRDDLVRSGDRWKFAARRFELRYAVDLGASPGGAGEKGGGR